MEQLVSGNYVLWKDNRGYREMSGGYGMKMRRKKVALALSFIIFSAGMQTELFNVSAEENSAGGQKSITGYSEYDEIILEYYRGASSGWGIQEFSENGLCYLAGYNPDVDLIGYCLMDIDNNGIEELLIGDTEVAYLGVFYDLYTLSDHGRILVATSGERDCNYLCTDNLIENEGSGSAFTSSWTFKYLNGTQLEHKETVFCDGYYDEENPWFYTTMDTCDDHSTPISEEEAIAIRNKYERKAIPFIPLSEIEIESNQGMGEESSTDRNVNASVLKQQASEEVAAVERSASELEYRLENDKNISQSDINHMYGELFSLWDNELNVLWSYLKQSLPADEMESLTQDELSWINDKESKISEAGMEFEGGSMRSMAEASKAAEITKERVYYLLNMLP